MKVIREKSEGTTMLLYDSCSIDGHLCHCTRARPTVSFRTWFPICENRESFILRKFERIQCVCVYSMYVCILCMYVLYVQYVCMYIMYVCTLGLQMLAGTNFSVFRWPIFSGYLF